MSQGPIGTLIYALLGTVAKPLNLDVNGNLKVVEAASPTPSYTPVQNGSGDVANASAVATLPAAAGKTTYISGFSITSSGATAASVVQAILSGLLGGSQTYEVTVTAGATLANNNLNVTFSPPLPASAQNTAIVLTLPALGAGNAHASVNAWGYQL